MTQHGMTARAHDRILKVARTVADLEAPQPLKPKHIAEAIQYRTLDRTFLGLRQWWCGNGLRPVRRERTSAVQAFRRCHQREPQTASAPITHGLRRGLHSFAATRRGA